MNNPLVSVIVPNYNHARYLPERMDSILRQTYQNFEIIILDDVSTDNSKEIIETYRSDPHVSKIEYNDVNSGSTFKQWHKGFELANGELIWIAESDDKCESTMLEKLVNEFRHDENLVLAFSLTCYFQEITGLQNKRVPLDKEPITRVDGARFIRRYMLYGSYVGNASCAVFKKNVALSIDDYYMSFKNAGDRLFWIQVAERGNVSIINTHLNYCRRHGDNITEKNYTNGTMQRESRLVYNYIKNKQLASKFSCKRAAAIYVYGINHTNFSSRAIKDELLDLWEIGVFEKCYICVMEIKATLAKVKHIIFRD